MRASRRRKRKVETLPLLAADALRSKGFALAIAPRRRRAARGGSTRTGGGDTPRRTRAVSGCEL
jgi:hypothetical protein